MNQGDRKVFDNAIENVQEAFAAVVAENERLKAENRELKSEHYKDMEILKLKRQLEEAHGRIDKILNAHKHGFSIDDDEMSKILKWMRSHEHERHGIGEGDEMYQGAIGGNYTYQFIPTSIGVIGQVECGSCHETFVFQDLT